MDRRTAQTVVEDVGAGLDIFDRDFILEIEGLVFRAKTATSNPSPPNK